jgi:hypothetical protein
MHAYNFQCQRLNASDDFHVGHPYSRQIRLEIGYGREVPDPLAPHIYT